MTASQKAASRTVVGVSMLPDELAELDRQRAQLGNMSRPATLKLVWQRFGDDTLEAAAARRDSLNEAVAESIETLTEAVRSMEQAYARRTVQRQAIGVHSNQIAKLANVYRVHEGRGEEISHDDLDAIKYATEGVERALARQTQAEQEDEELRTEVREVVARLRSVLRD